MERTRIQVGADQYAWAVSVKPGCPAEQIVAALELPRPRALLVVNGGTADLEPALHQRLAALLVSGLGRTVVQHGITLISGGTNAGIFSLLGDGLERWGRSAPCIGVTVADRVGWVTHGPDRVPLERHHSHFVFVEGQDWGAETTTMYALVAELAHQCPMVTLFAGGGRITLDEMEANVQQNRQMILLAGSQRSTDAVLALRAGAPVQDPRLTLIAAHAKIHAFDIEQPPSALAALLCDLLDLAPEATHPA